MTDMKLEYFYMGRLDDCRKLDSKFAKIAREFTIKEFFENLYKPIKKYFIKNEEEKQTA